MKTKKEILDERLDRIKKNSEKLIMRMDQKIETMNSLKEDLNKKSYQIDKWENDYRDVLKTMAERMLGVKIIINPLQCPVQGFCQLPTVKQIGHIVERISQVKTICILTGAGVSTKSGIPAFRGKNGFNNCHFEKGDEKLTPEQFLTYQNFKECPELIWKWSDKFLEIVKNKEPNINHKLIHFLLMNLKKKGKDISLVTTNIDGLHKKVSLDNLQFPYQEIHGNIFLYICENCKTKQYWSKQSQRDNFKCKHCKFDKCRPNVMFFDEKYGELFGENVKNKKYDMVFSIGSSLSTGLSIKIVSEAQETVQINPKCVITSGKVFKFESQCTPILEEMIKILDSSKLLPEKKDLL